MIRIVLLLLLLSSGAWGQVRHGAPIRALAVLANGDVVSAGLDSAIFVWRDGEARVLRFHEGAVGALVAVPGGFASGGEDGRVAYWRAGEAAPYRVEAQAGPVTALGLVPDGRLLVAPVHLWLPESARLAASPAPVNAVAFAGEVAVAAGADGVLRLFGADGTARGEIELAAGPLVGLAVRDGLVAVASLSGTAVVVEVATGRIVSVVHTGEMAVWAVAFMADGTLLTGGSGRSVRRWEAMTGRGLGSIGPGPVLPAVAGDRGAQVFRACAVCHALVPDGGTQAGPSLHRLFGRPVGGLAGYPYSEALRRRGGVWTVEALSELFVAGPQAFAPGTTMPEQILADPDDRAALARFLERQP